MVVYQSLANLSISGEEIRMVMKAVGLGTHGSYGGHWYFMRRRAVAVIMSCFVHHPIVMACCCGILNGVVVS